MNGPIIEVKDLSKQYTIGERAPYGSLREEIMQALAAPFKRASSSEENTIWALKDVSFEVKQGEVLGIIGRNGAGKSTLLKILSRITEPTGGRVELRGRVASLLEVGTGFHPELTGRENILLNGALLGMTREEIRRKFDEIVDFAEIEKFLDTPVKRYSSGMYVRLAFAVAAHLEPEILLVDEVLAVGDVAFQRKCLGKMGDVAKGGRTVLFVSHNMSAVSRLCSKAILLDGGGILNSGTTQEVIESYLSRVQDNFGQQQAELRYNEETKGPARIRRIRISDRRGRPSLRHDIHDNIRIDVDFVVERYVPNMFVACTVLTNMGQCIYSTNDMDWSNYTGSGTEASVSKVPGTYRASVVLPAPLLHLGIYELVICLAVPKVGTIDDRRGIFIEIVDSGSFMSFPFKRDGILAVPLKWEVEQCNSKIDRSSKGAHNGVEA